MLGTSKEGNERKLDSKICYIHSYVFIAIGVKLLCKLITCNLCIYKQVVMETKPRCYYYGGEYNLALAGSDL